MKRSSREMQEASRDAICIINDPNIARNIIDNGCTYKAFSDVDEKVYRAKSLIETQLKYWNSQLTATAKKQAKETIMYIENRQSYYYDLIGRQNDNSLSVAEKRSLVW